jgi:hypothetical protein
MGSGIMQKRDGLFWKENPNSKGLDRPRMESNYIKTSCVSVGMPGGGGGADAKMQFSSKQPDSELWGKQKRTYVQQTPREEKAPPPKKMPLPDKK